MDWGADVVEEYGWRKGPWTAQEDKLLTQHVNLHGEGRWNSVSKLTGLRRCGKSCRLRWVNYLRPDLKRGKITPEEETIILDLHALWGNRWSTIARSLPGRTDNAIKNYWRIHFKKSKPSKNTVKARAQFLRQQQELQKQEEEQHQQKKQDENNMRMMMNQEEIALPQDMEQEIMCPLTFMLQGGFISHGSTEEGSWGSLWQLDDDMQTDVQGMRHGSLQVQDQVLAFY